MCIRDSANAVQLARCDNQHIMGLQRHGLARNRNRVGTLDGGDDLARGMPVPVSYTHLDVYKRQQDKKRKQEYECTKSYCHYSGW